VTRVDDATTISKHAALEITATAWRTHILPKNLVSGFRQAGIWPLCREQMNAQLAKYASGGLPTAYEVKDWLLAQDEVPSTVLTTPAEPAKRAPKRRVRFSGQIISVALMGDINAEKEATKKVAASAKGTAAKHATAAKRTACKSIAATKYTTAPKSKAAKSTAAKSAVASSTGGEGQHHGSDQYHGGGVQEHHEGDEHGSVALVRFVASKRGVGRNWLRCGTGGAYGKFGRGYGMGGTYRCRSAWCDFPCTRPTASDAARVHADLGAVKCRAHRIFVSGTEHHTGL